MSNFLIDHKIDTSVELQTILTTSVYFKLDTWGTGKASLTFKDVSEKKSLLNFY